MVHVDEINGRLRARRMTQTDMAAKMGISSRTLHKMLQSPGNEKLWTIERMEKAMESLDIPDTVENWRFYFFNRDLHKLQNPLNY
jgi:transcriptional regulator with XRE-family HTH domain